MSGTLLVRACRWVTFNEEKTEFRHCPNNATLFVLESGSVTTELICEPHVV